MPADCDLRSLNGAEALAGLRALAIKAHEGLSDGMPLPMGEALLAHMTGGLGNPAAALILLDAVDELLAESQAAQRLAGKWRDKAGDRLNELYTMYAVLEHNLSRIAELDADRNVLTGQLNQARARVAELEAAQRLGAGRNRGVCAVMQALGQSDPRRWTHARDIPPGVTVTAPVYTSDSRMRWTRRDSGLFTESYPGFDDVYVTAEYMDARVGTTGYVEVQP